VIGGERYCGSFVYSSVCSVLIFLHAAVYGTAQEACPRILYDYVPSMTTFPFLHLTKLFAISANRVPLHHRNRSGSYNAYSITLVSILLLSRRKGVFFMPIVMEDDCMFTH
jgi:hypothetical protein